MNKAVTDFCNFVIQGAGCVPGINEVEVMKKDFQTVNDMILANNFKGKVLNYIKHL